MMRNGIRDHFLGNTLVRSALYLQVEHISKLQCRAKMVDRWPRVTLQDFPCVFVRYARPSGCECRWTWRSSVTTRCASFGYRTVRGTPRAAAVGRTAATVSRALRMYGDAPRVARDAGASCHPGIPMPAGVVTVAVPGDRGPCVIGVTVSRVRVAAFPLAVVPASVAPLLVS